MVFPMKLLITGGNGFIGSAVVRHCIADLGWHVVNIDALTKVATLGSVASVLGSNRYSHRHIDILDRAAVERVFVEEQPDAVLHLAAESHVDRSIDAPLEFVHVNVTGTVHMLEAARHYFKRLGPDRQKLFRFHHVSTDEVFGSLELDGGSFSETTAYAPSSPYSASKAASDHFVRAYGHTYGLPILITNCSNNYGPFHFPEKLIPLMIIKAMRQQSLPVYGSGLNVRDWLYVEDHARALTTVLQKGRIGETYAIGGNAECNNLTVVQMICDILDQKLGLGPKGPRRNLISHVIDRPGHDMRYAIDASKLSTELGWQPTLNFEQGLQRTVMWYLDNQDWWGPLIDGPNYKGERLGAPAN
jgi:dTDP-glucose 4,6-dehydratase